MTISTRWISGATTGSPIPQRQQTQRWQSDGAGAGLAQEEQDEVIGQSCCDPQGEAASMEQHPLRVKLSPIPIPRGIGGIAPRTKAEKRMRARIAPGIMPLQPAWPRSVSAARRFPIIGKLRLRVSMRPASPRPVERGHLPDARRLAGPFRTVPALPESCPRCCTGPHARRR